MKNRIIVTGGNGRFASILKKENKKLNLFFFSKDKLDILNLNSIERVIKKIKPKILIHCAALSRPMSVHENDISKSIDLNIIGTANITKMCKKFNVKLIYFSTAYVYEGTKGNYKESDPVKPFNNYALSKLGGECAVSMYDNSLILRIQMTEKPFRHNEAYTNVISNYLFHEDLAKILHKLLNRKGILNIGGKSQSVYNFAKNYDKKIKKILIKKQHKTPLKQTMNLSKLKKILSKK